LELKEFILDTFSLLISTEILSDEGGTVAT